MAARGVEWAFHGAVNSVSKHVLLPVIMRERKQAWNRACALAF
jgi:hypothetical protein